MAAAAGFAQQQRQAPAGRPGNKHVEHDSLSNADYSLVVDGNRNAVFTAKAGDFVLEKALDASGSFTLRLTQGKDVVTIVSDSAGYLVARDKRTARFDPRASSQGDARDAVRAVLLGSPAVRSFRRLGVILENRDEPEDESALMINTLIDSAIVQMLDGDPGAVPRVAKRVVRKQRAKLQAVRLPGPLLRDCVGLYEASLMDAWMQFEQCMQWANNVHWWYQDWA
jgi:hypothetical protein